MSAIATRPRQFLSGNEALAIGAFEAGVTVAAAYPGTPSTEIIETLATFAGVRAEWSVNEKIALEVAIGASMAGRRVHRGDEARRRQRGVRHPDVGDPDGRQRAAWCSPWPTTWASRRRRTNRTAATGRRFAHLPVLEPRDAQEAYLMAREAFDLSERHQMPVLMRLTTRMCHVKRVVVMQGPLPAPERLAYVKDPVRWIVTPNHVAGRIEVRTREAALRAEAEASHWNFVESGADRRLGVIASGPACHAVREALPNAPLLGAGLQRAAAGRTGQAIRRECRRGGGRRRDRAADRNRIARRRPEGAWARTTAADRRSHGRPRRCGGAPAAGRA